MSLHRFHRFGLTLLIFSIFTHKSHSAIHLREILGTEYKHQLTLHIAIAMHITHGLHKALFTLCEFFLKIIHMSLKRMDIAVKTVDVMTYCINRLSLIGNLIINNQQVLQSFLDVALISLKFTLLFLNLFTNPLLFIFQTINRNGLLRGG